VEPASELQTSDATAPVATTLIVTMDSAAATVERDAALASADAATDVDRPESSPFCPAGMALVEGMFCPSPRSTGNPCRGLTR
jgi:hypothetical protein